MNFIYPSVLSEATFSIFMFLSFSLSPERPDYKLFSEIYGLAPSQALSINVGKFLYFCFLRPGGSRLTLYS